MLFIPVDSRPVSVALPRRIAGCGGAKLKMSPVSRLGGLDEPGDVKGIMRWLRTHFAGEAGALAVSIDSLLFGGLVFSRETGVELKHALKALDELARLKEKSPGVKVFAFQSVLRDAITVRDEVSMGRWKGMMGGKGYPVWFLELRKRNLGVSKRLIELAGEGVVDCLVLAKEDTSPDSPFLDEVETLRSEIEEKEISDRAFVTTGTDEAMLLLIARRICETRGAGTRFVFIGGGRNWRRRIPPYEHRPLSETLAEQVRLAGGEVVKEGDEDAIEVVVHFYGETQDIFLRQLDGRRSQPADGEAVEKTVSLVGERLERGARVALLDCAFANGGDAKLVRRLLEEKLFFKLFSYAGWNTHANRAGNLIAHSAITAAAASRSGARRQLRRHVHYMVERAVHDCVYSTVVRGRLTEFADAAGNVIDPAEAERALREQMVKETYRLFRPALEGPVDAPCGWGMVSLQGVPVSRAGFPWGRLFEIDCVCEPALAVNRLNG